MNGCNRFQGFQAFAVWALAIGVLAAAPSHAARNGAVTLSDAPKRIVLPTETATLRPGPNSALAQSVCGACHSVDYVTTQPVLSRSQWGSEIEKMKTSFGAGPGWASSGITDAQLGAILDYLVGFYGKE